MVAGIAGGISTPNTLDLPQGTVEGVVGEQLAPCGGIGSPCLGRRSDPGAPAEREPLQTRDLAYGGGAAPDRAGDGVT